MDARERIRQLMQERNWTIYRLAKEAGMSQTTVSNIFKRNNEPSIPTLRRLCAAFGITMAQFFTTAQDTEHTKEQQELIALCRKGIGELTARQKALLGELV